MESFQALKRRTTEILSSLTTGSPPSSPTQAASGGHTLLPGGSPPAAEGTWQYLSASLPSLPRSSHTVSVVDGVAYIFGGETGGTGDARKPVGNDMHAVTLPSEGYGGDYVAIKAVPAPREDEGKTEGEGQEEGIVDAKGKAVETTGSRHKNEDVLPNVPPPRVGHTAAVIGTRIFVFGGRAGPTGAETLDERGRVWVFSTKQRTWSYLDPVAPLSPPAAVAASTAEGQQHPAVPPPRSYHSMAATDKPDHKGDRDHPTRPRRAQSWRQWVEGDSAEVGIPQAPRVGPVAERAEDDEAPWTGRGFGTLFVSGGCLADGKRTRDCWAFDVRARVWTRLPDYPVPYDPEKADEEERIGLTDVGAASSGKGKKEEEVKDSNYGGVGGAAMAVLRSRLYRFGGFDGTRETGGRLDCLPLEVDVFDDGSGPPTEVAVRAHADGWQAVAVQGRGETLAEATAAWPDPRSVSALVPLQLGGGRECLVLLFGEKSPAPPGMGHAGTGRFCDDVWIFTLPPRGMTTASIGQAIWNAIDSAKHGGRPHLETHRWTPVETRAFDEESERDAQGPGPRGWIAAAPAGSVGEERGVVVWGGVDPSGNRLGDCWLLRID